MLHSKSEKIAIVTTVRVEVVFLIIGAIIVREQLLVESATNRVRVLEDELAGLNAQFESLEDLPTWPFDSSLRRRLTLGNVSLVVPVLIGNLNKVREGLTNLIAS